MSRFNEQGSPVGSPQNISVAAVVKSLTVPGAANMAIVQIIDASSHATATKALRYTYDGASPANTVNSGLGFVLGELDYIVLNGKAQMDAFKMMSTEANTVLVYVEYFKGNV